LKTALFVYGTLRPGRAPRAVRAVVATLRPVATGRVRGRLYDLGEFPGAILDEAAPGLVHGDVVELSAVSPALAWFDEYEGFDASAPERSRFVRERCEAETAAGRISCWIWVLARAPARARVIESGEWHGGAD